MIIIGLAAGAIIMNSCAMEFKDSEEAAAFEAIKPCSQDECEKFKAMFNQKQCGQQCRVDQITKLATNFDFEIKRDGQFLRALICADKNRNSYMVKEHDKPRSSYERSYFYDRAVRPGFGDGGTFTDRPAEIEFLNGAIARNNLDFVKVFFKLFPPGEPDADFKNRSILRFYPRFAIFASKEIFQLLEEKTKLTYNGDDAETLCTSRERNAYPGCQYYLERLRAHREKQEKKRKKEKQELKDENQKWEQGLRDIVKS